ncbi:hypothetical protein ACH3XW_37130 [Acanthocheilonema viteae]
MLCTALFVDGFPSTLEYIPCCTTILSSFIESVVADTARIVPIGNHISVFIPVSETERKAELMDATMQTSPGAQLSTSMIARRLRDMADRFEYHYMEKEKEEQRSICTSASWSSQPQLRGLSFPFLIAFATKKFINALLKRIFERFYQRKM